MRRISVRASVTRPKGGSPVRSAMERPMAFWKTEQFAPSSMQGGRAQYLDIAALIGLAAAPGILFVWLMPLPFVPPVICVVSFLIACVFAWFAYHIGAGQRAAQAAARDVAGIFTLLWVGAGLASDHAHLIQFFELLTRTQ
jgi:hypothetical protein